MKPLALLSMLALGACAPAQAVPPAEIREPAAELVRPAPALAPVPPDTKADAVMWGAYAQCRAAHADVADRHHGLVDYVVAIRRR